MVKTYNKTIRRMFKSNILRMITVSLVIAIGICIVTAIGSLPERIRDSVSFLSAPEQIVMVETMADKVEMLSFVFPIFFIAVSALTAFATMTRLIEEDRATAACLKTLGYSNFSIIMKYIIFAFVCSFLGCLIGIFFGNFVLSKILFDSVMVKFDIIKSPDGIYISLGIICSAIMIAAIVITTLGVSLQKCRENPAMLLRPKAPKMGSKVFLEKIPFIWKPLKFKYKSSVRNIIRYKSRLIMTVLSVAGSTAIAFCGFGLYFSMTSLKDESANMAALADSIIPICAAIIFCAIALAVLVLFNLTNINIEERKREIATLKVLGYRQIEVAGYIYREILLLSILGIILGVPCGYFLLRFVFDYLEFGSIEHIKWLTWFLTPLVSLLSVLLTDLLLYGKVNKIQMHTSLKTVE